jgi:SAM-dependent methyltransferase
VNSLDSIAPRGWADQVKDQVGARYGRLAEADAFRPGAGARAREAGYPATLPARIADRYSGCGYALDGVDLSGVRVAVDLGCGAGLDARLLAGKLADGAVVIALDLAPAMLGRVREAAPRNAIPILALAGDMEQLPLDDAIADLVIANASFNLTVDKPAAFAEAARILRPGGRLIARELVRERDLPGDLAQDPAAWNASLGGVPLENELYDLLREAGFAAVRITGHNPFPPVIAIRLEATKPETRHKGGSVPA